MRKIVKNILTTAALVAAMSVSLAAQTINLPPNWPEQKVMLGLSWASPADGEAIQAFGTNLSNYYTYRYMDLTFMSEAQALGAISEMQTSANSYPGTVNPSVIMQLFLDGTISNTPDETRADALLNKMNNAAAVGNFFSLLERLSSPVNSAGKAVVILEPNTWGYILQARFHKETELHPTYGIPYSEILNFPATVKYSTLAAGGVSLDINKFGFLEEYENTVAGLAQAMVRASKQFMPTATVAGHMASWAVFADGCSGGASSASAADVMSGVVDVKATQSVVTWQKEDREISAVANVAFMRELYGWNSETKAPIDTANWPHTIAVEKGAVDAGLVLYGPGQGLYDNAKVGAGTNAFFWGQDKNDNWLAWAGFVSQGIKLPLIAFRMPTGNGSLTQNTAFHYQDTFMDWLYSSTNWTTPIPGYSVVETWSPDNLRKFKEAGFIAIFTGRDGWPAVGTHYGARSSNGGTGGPSVPITGDNGFAITSYVNSDMNFTPIPVTFDEDNFSTFTGFCQAGEATSKAEYVGNIEGTSIWNAKNPNGISTEDYILSLPEGLNPEIKENTILFQAVVGTNDDGSPKTALLESQGISQAAADQAGNVTGMKIMIEIKIPEMGHLAGLSDADKAVAVGSIWPLAFNFQVFDAAGQFISSIKDTIPEDEILDIAQSTPDGSLEIKFLTQILPWDQTGRLIGSGVYILRGYFEEQTKFWCQNINEETPRTMTFAEVANQEWCASQLDVEWKAATLNSLPMSRNLGYVRTSP